MSNLTEVLLLKTNLEKDYNHTLYFGSLNDQLSYFKGLPKREFLDFSYQRKDSFIRIPVMYDEVINYNYVMYRNTNYSNKYYFAFITDIKFFSEGKTDIYIETDVIQTYMFDYEIKKSFVEREHVNDDTIGKHTYPEQVQLGEYIINASQKVEELIPSGMIMMGSTEVPSGEGASVGAIYNGIYSGVKYYLYNTENLTRALQDLADDGKSDAVSSVFVVPKLLSHDCDKVEHYEDGTAYNPTRAPGGIYQQSYYPVTKSIEVNKTYGLDGYTPKNNKLKTFPYCYLLASNGNGGVAEYQYEFFEENLQCDFVIKACITPGCSIRLTPAIYKGVQLPESEGLNLGKYPQCNWATDQFTNWLTQNGVNIATSIAGSVVGVVGGVASGNVGGVVGGVGGIANTIGEVYKASRIPPQTSGNINCGDVVTSSGDNTFTFYNMSIRKEYAEMIDNYFSMFGYKVNKLKIPNKNHRKNWWYTKTIDITIVGNIPQQDLQKIKQCYNNGITFWRTSNFKNYDVDNSIL